LTRQSPPLLRISPQLGADQNLCARGAYVLDETSSNRQVTLLSTGSEVSVAVAASRMLAAEGIGAAVASMPCWELFETQPEEYRSAVLGSAPRVAVEAAVELGGSAGSARVAPSSA
jgi:transketolase